MDGIQKIWPKWTPVEVIGKGGFGTVYKAKRENFGEVLWSAIKVVQIPNDESEVKEMMTSGFSQNQIKEYYRNSVKMLIDEIRLMDTLKSASHIVSIEDFEVVELEERVGWKVYIRMELLTNILNLERMRVDEVKKMAIHILSALEHCHRLNIVHRDIKPGNIFVSSFGEYKLGDFGVSRQVERANATMSQKGTKSYMAPEMIRLEKTYDHTVDLYALGLTMYELLNYGRMPFLPKYPDLFFPQDREEAMLKRLMGEPFPEIEGIGYLNAIIQKACAFDPKQRYQSATEMKNDLMGVVDKKIIVDEEKTINNFKEDETINMFGKSSIFDQTMSGFDEKEENDQTINMFGKTSFVFEDSVVVNKDVKYVMTKNDKKYYLAFSNGYFDLEKDVHITTNDQRTIQLKLMYQQYLSHSNKIEILEKMVEMDTNAKLYALLGDEYYKNGQKDLASEWYTKAYKLDQEDSYILKRIALNRYHQGEYLDAIGLTLQGINNYQEGKASCHIHAVHALYFIKALCYQALNDEVNAVRAISDLYDFNFKSYHASFTRAEQITTIYHAFNPNEFIEELLVNDQWLSTKLKIYVACMHYQIGGQLFKKYMTKYADKLKDTYLNNPNKVAKLQKKMGIEYDEIYTVVTTALFGDCAFGQYGMYKWVEKKVFFLDYYGIAHMLFGSYDSANLMIKKIEDYGSVGWRSMVSGARKTPYIYLSLCELKHEIVQKTTLPLEAPFLQVGYLYNANRLRLLGIHTIGDFVRMKDEDLFQKFVNPNDYLYLQGLKYQL